MCHFRFSTLVCIFIILTLTEESARHANNNHGRILSRIGFECLILQLNMFETDYKHSSTSNPVLFYGDSEEMQNDTALLVGSIFNSNFRHHCILIVNRVPDFEESLPRKLVTLLPKVYQDFLFRVAKYVVLTASVPNNFQFSEKRYFFPDFAFHIIGLLDSGQEHIVQLYQCNGARTGIVIVDAFDDVQKARTKFYGDSLKWVIPWHHEQYVKETEYDMNNSSRNLY